jgi:hypothetical protein
MNEFAIKGLINDWPPHIQPSCQNPLAALEANNQHRRARRCPTTRCGGRQSGSWLLP